MRKATNKKRLNLLGSKASSVYGTFFRLFRSIGAVNCLIRLQAVAIMHFPDDAKYARQQVVLNEGPSCEEW